MTSSKQFCRCNIAAQVCLQLCILRPRHQKLRNEKIRLPFDIFQKKGKEKKEKEEEMEKGNGNKQNKDNKHKIISKCKWIIC